VLLPEKLGEGEAGTWEVVPRLFEESGWEEVRSGCVGSREGKICYVKWWGSRKKKGGPTRN
jgi:hypothetical protein